MSQNEECETTKIVFFIIKSTLTTTCDTTISTLHSKIFAGLQAPCRLYSPLAIIKIFLSTTVTPTTLLACHSTDFASLQ